METFSLTSSDLKALRNADTVFFRYVTEHNVEPDVEPGAFVDVFKRHDPGDGFGEREMLQRIQLERGMATIYEDDGVSGRRDLHRAWWSFSTAKFTPALVTVLSLLKPGDKLVPHWVAGNNSNFTREVGATLDEFHLRVFRPTKSDRDKVLEFMLDARVTAPHSLGRDLKFGERKDG